MKNLFAVIFLSLCASLANAQITVINFNAPYRLKNGQAIQNADGRGEVWFVGGSGDFVVNTRDDRIEKKISEVDLNSVFIVNEQTAFVVGNSGELLVSKNHGENWEKIVLNTKVNLNSIFCLNEQKCWIVGGKDGLLIRGGIGGKWEIKNIVSNGELEDVYFVNENIGFAVGRHNLLLKTDDGGESWTRINLSYETRVGQFIDGLFWFESVSFLNSKIGCVAGWNVGNSIVACTRDQGKTWKVNLIDAHPKAIVWKSEKEVYLVDKYGENLISKDAGKTWEATTEK